jgi:hypothetical protein
MSTFGFRASAAAMGGIFTRPFHEPLPVQAASTLPSVGGYGSARVENFRFHELVSFTAGYTQVIGVEYEDEGARERSTLALAVVEGLNVLDMVTADRVVGRLVSETPLPADKGERAAVEARELTWLPAGSYFVNLRIGGVLVNATPHKALTGEEGLTRDGVEQIQAKRGITRKGEPLRCSMFDTEHPIRIPGFGDIFLGEYVVGRDYRKLTMIRIAMHSPAGGDLAVASLEGNGSSY